MGKRKSMGNSRNVSPWTSGCVSPNTRTSTIARKGMLILYEHSVYRRERKESAPPHVQCGTVVRSRFSVESAPDTRERGTDSETDFRAHARNISAAVSFFPWKCELCFGAQSGFFFVEVADIARSSVIDHSHQHQRTVIFIPRFFVKKVEKCLHVMSVVAY